MIYSAPNEDEWIKAPLDELIRNEPRTLELNLPSSLKEGAKYFVAVCSFYSPSGGLRSSAVEGISSSSLIYCKLMAVTQLIFSLFFVILV